MEKMSQKVARVLMLVTEMMTPSCDVISQKISRSMDAKISLKDRLEIKIHILGCVLCERYRDQLLTVRRMIEEYSRKAEGEMPDRAKGLSEEAAKRMKLALMREKKK